MWELQPWELPPWELEQARNVTGSSIGRRAMEG